LKTPDWIIVIIYALSVLIMGWCLGKRQKGVDDYFLAGRSLPWWAIGISTMDTQLSAISFISAPAFVGLRPGGGLVWLGYEFAVPFALIPLMHRIIPTFHQLRIVSIYQYLELRFNKATRRFVSIIFQISRALATGVGIYAGAIVMSVVLEIPPLFYDMFNRNNRPHLRLYGRDEGGCLFRCPPDVNPFYRYHYLYGFRSPLYRWLAGSGKSHAP